MKLKGSGVFVIEDLTKSRAQLLYKTCRLKGQTKIQYTWIKTGAIFVKLLNGDVMKIVSEEMYQELYVLITVT
ncbi:hypothetical protein LSH36_366g05051 [Paralvinella palmiformis]|uniref:Uncharacterized protein n=1 Tax=Paralvinella palmiformis TaxID=53620 RepID=A0AAD9JFH7_9ANNE|nr:hypothetical protein LSH36_366g05051 [Paralvinella palmiformis]